MDIDRKKDVLFNAREAHGFPSVPSDADWTPSLFPSHHFDSVSQWNDFRDSNQLNDLVKRGLDAGSSFDAVADITRAIDAMKLQKRYDDVENKKVRGKILDHASDTVKVLWEQRLKLQDDEQALRSNKRSSCRVYIRRYAATILSISLEERPDFFPYIKSPALDLYYWLYLIGITNQERDDPRCEVPRSVRKVCDMDEVWRSVAPKLLKDISIVAFQSRLLAGMDQTNQPGPGPKRRLQDTCDILRCSHVVSQEVSPGFYRLLGRGSKGVFVSLMTSEGPKQSFEVAGLFALCVSECAKRRSPGFLDEVYSDGKPIMSLIDDTSPLSEFLIMSAMPAVVYKKEEYLNLIHDTTAYVRTPQGSKLRQILANKLRNDKSLRQTYQHVELQDPDATKRPNGTQVRKSLDALVDALGLGHLLSDAKDTPSNTAGGSPADSGPGAPALPKLRGMFNKK
ncbi:hypothetical protein VNI00_002843 [Paramarasmius palmivorus]|uniref:Uncharacterized protein n=1 Tax=Paramarasmius palmivorus TaxID=297713 RepID=A0AAW0DXU6_9AGAR